MILIFGQNLPGKGISSWKQKKWTSPLNWIWHIWIKFQVKLSNLNQISAYTDNLDFSLHWQMFPKFFFWSKVRKVKITIEFWIFKLVWVPNFSLSWQFWLFGLNFPKMVFTVKIKNSENHGEFCICKVI